MHAQGFSEHWRDQLMTTLPFEFVALEACLDAACLCLDEEVQCAFITVPVLILLGFWFICC